MRLGYSKTKDEAFDLITHGGSSYKPVPDNRDRHTALLPGNAFQTSLPVFSCSHMLVVKIANKPAPLTQSDSNVIESKL